MSLGEPAMAGVFITFEGIDGSGKSAHSARIHRRLCEMGLASVLTREPGGTRAGLQIRSLLLSRDQTGLSHMAELMLYAADRAEHVDSLIRPALAAGKLVLSDRYSDSTLAFQGYGRGLDLATIMSLNRLATSGLEPDLTIVLDVDPAIATARLRSRCSDNDDRFHAESSEFHKKVREGYLRLASENPRRFRVVDSSPAIDQVHSSIFELIAPLLEEAVARPLS